MVRKPAAALLLALILLPFTAPFPTFTLLAPASGAGMPMEIDTSAAQKDAAWSAGCSDLLRHRFHALPVDVSHPGGDIVDAYEVPQMTASQPPRDLAARSAVLRI